MPRLDRSRRHRSHPAPGGPHEPTPQLPGRGDLRRPGHRQHLVAVIAGTNAGIALRALAIAAVATVLAVVSARQTRRITAAPSTTAQWWKPLALGAFALLHHIGIGRRHAGRCVLILVKDLHVRITTTDGETLRDFHLDPNRNYQPQPKT